LNNKIITVLVDNESWILPYAERLITHLRDRSYHAYLVRHASEVKNGWINFMLGCTQILAPTILSRNTHNLVVHESDLPHGRGFSPMTWQILEGKRTIPVCLIEASEMVDAGNIWIRDVMKLDGTELCDEWRAIQGEKTLELCLRFVDEYKILHPLKQTGTPSRYKRRYPKDSLLDVEKSIRQQFDLLRVVDNEKYPAYFVLQGCVYSVRIEKVNRNGNFGHAQK